MNDAGRVGYVLRGDYNPSTTYEFLDVVNFNGGSYVARVTTTGHAPTETTYWYPQSNTHIATASTLGVVKVDNDTIKIQQDGTLVGSQSGHTIRNTMNTDATPKETNLRFAGAKITDDSTNETTKVEFYYEYPTLAAAQADIANIPEGARVIIKEADYVGQIDNALSLTSVNPVQNKVVTAAINQISSWIVVFYYGTQIGVPNYTRNNNILLKVGHLVFMSCNFNITSRGNGTSPRISTGSYKLPYKPNATAVGTLANSIKTLNMVAEKDNDEYFILKNLDGTDATVTDMATGDVTLTIVYTTDE